MPPSGTTGWVALLGDPVAHSVSPAIHAAGFAAHGLDLVYLACRVAPARLAAAVAGLDALGAVGANVTVPHKGAVVPLAAERAPDVDATGAANTLVRTPHGWRAENTDVTGFAAPLVERGWAGDAAVVLGAGGAARAVAYSLATRLGVRRVTLVARRPAQAEALATYLAPHLPEVAWTVLAPDAARAAVRDAPLVVNTTPVGTADPSATPWADASAFRAGQTVYDLVYRPAETRLLREARAAGAATLGGLPMLVAQAAASFQLWTGRDLPLGAARAAADAALAR